MRESCFRITAGRQSQFGDQIRLMGFVAIAVVDFTCSFEKRIDDSENTVLGVL